MDWMTIFIAICLVFTGAAFFGFPVGYVYAKRRFWEAIEHDFVIIDWGENGFRRIPASKAECRKDIKDVLNAEIIEERKR